MNYLVYLQGAIAVAQEVLDALKKNSPGEEAAIASLEAAIAKLQEVQGSDVTWQQLNDLRTEKQW